MLFKSHGFWSGPPLAVPNLVVRGLVVLDSSAPYQTMWGRSERTGNGLRISTEKRRWGSGGRCQIINCERDNALHSPIARDKTERKLRKPSRRSIVRWLQISSAIRIQATLNFNLADLYDSRHMRAIPWPSGRWRAQRRIDTGHAGRLHGLERALGRVQSRFRSGGRVGRGEGWRRRHRSGGGPLASRDTHRRGRYSAVQRTCARRTGRSARRTGGLVGSTARDEAPLTTPLDGVRNRWRAAATKSGAQALSPAGHRGRVQPRMLLRAVSGSNSGRWGGSGGQGPSGPCDPGCRIVLLRHVTPFAFSIIATFPTLTRPQIPEDTNADCLLWSEEQVPGSKYMCASLQFESTLS